MSLSSSSRFKATPLITVITPSGVEVETYGSWVQLPFLLNPNLPVKRYTVSNAFAGRVDLISQDVYETDEYFWVIIAYNKPRNPFNWPNAGDVIFIPDLGSIVSEL